MLVKNGCNFFLLFQILLLLLFLLLMMMMMFLFVGFVTTLASVKFTNEFYSRLLRKAKIQCVQISICQCRILRLDWPNKRNHCCCYVRLFPSFLYIIHCSLAVCTKSSILCVYTNIHNGKYKRTYTHIKETYDTIRYDAMIHTLHIRCSEYIYIYIYTRMQAYRNRFL